MRGRSRLALTHTRLTQWRAQHGGRGIPVPEELWAEVLKVARVEGAGATARALRLDRARLEARMAMDREAEVAEASSGFVELDTGRLGLSDRTVVRFHGRDGEWLEVEIGTGATMVETFFRGYLHGTRGASRHTVLAYRDGIRLLLSFVADACSRQVADVRLDDLTVERVLGFLDHLEATRRNGIATRNLRLTAIRTFFRHLVREDPARGAQYQRVLSIPLKRKATPVITYLEPEEVKVLLRQPDRRKQSGARDHALLLFLYNTGARIGEALAVQRADLQLARPFQVRLHGKGRKDRVCPLWQETASALRRLIGESSPTGLDPFSWIPN